MLSIIDPGDDGDHSTPYWVTYSELVKLCQGEIVFVPCSIENKYKITPEQLEATITPKNQTIHVLQPL